jgi:SAM-dependent methyltransferase
MNKVWIGFWDVLYILNIFYIKKGDSMPDMMEIYQQHAYEYDELVTKEDYEGNLPKLLHQIVDFSDKEVVELGAGTGRVTAMYADMVKKVHFYDGAPHMVERAKKNLGRFSCIEYGICDNLHIHELDLNADCVLEGWSFGHTISANSDDVPTVTDKLVHDCSGLLKENGSIVFIESMGTFVDEPTLPREAFAVFFERLKKKHGFKEQIIRTDYRFDSVMEASRICGFFFGEHMGAAIAELKEPVVKEFTGVWYREY